MAATLVSAWTLLIRYESEMILVVDAGNTRIKYGCHDGNEWLSREVLEGDTFRFPLGFLPRRIVVACVAGNAQRAFLQQALAPWAGSVEWLRASALRCGLRCAYDDPQVLGADRWAAAIAAWQLFRSSCLVLSAGTATTIDIVRASGVYEGGCILPGLSMMIESLARGTAGLPVASGSVQLPPRNTHDAIHTGCVLAQVGALRELAALVPPDSPVIVTGGAAESLLPVLGGAVRFSQWLVLEGLLAVAQDGPLSA